MWTPARRSIATEIAIAITERAKTISCAGSRNPVCFTSALITLNASALPIMKRAPSGTHLITTDGTAVACCFGDVPGSLLCRAVPSGMKATRQERPQSNG